MNRIVNRKGSFFVTVVFILIILGVVVFLGYKYVYPEFKNKKVLASADEKYNGFVDFTYADILMKLPEDWKQMDVSDVTSLNSIALKVNPSSDEDFMYIWRYGYAFDSKALAGEVIQYNFEEISSKEVEINKNKFYNKVVSVQEDEVTRIYDTYAIVKNNIGYVFTLRCSADSYPVFKDKFVKVVESIKFK